MKEIRLCDDCQGEFTRDYCVKYGLGIEVQGFYDPYSRNHQKLQQEYQSILQTVPGGRSFHAPFWDLNLGSKMQGIKQETMNIFNAAYNTAKELGCTELIVHNGYIPGTSPYSKWVERAVAFWKEFFADKDSSITVCIENQFEIDSEILQMEIDAVNDPRLKVCLDTGHAHACSDMPVEEWISTLGDRIAYLHLHNNHGKQHKKGYNDDEHLGLDNGTLDMTTVLKRLEHYAPQAIWAIECSPKYFDESLTYLKAIAFLPDKCA